MSSGLRKMIHIKIKENEDREWREREKKDLAAHFGPFVCICDVINVKPLDSDRLLSNDKYNFFLSLVDRFLNDKTRPSIHSFIHLVTNPP